MAASPAARLDYTPYDGPPVPERLRARYPRMVEYLAQLPDGMYAYPECQARSAILETFVAAAPGLQGAALDPVVARLLQSRSRGFIPEVALEAAFLAIADATGLDEARFIAWNRESNRALFTGLLFRALMGFFSPMILLERAPARWEAFHLGTRLTVEPDGPTAAVAVLAHPERLYTPLLLRGIAACYAIVCEQARARDVSVTLAESGPTAATFVARWR